jgi:hypothetical protein
MFFLVINKFADFSCYKLENRHLNLTNYKKSYYRVDNQKPVTELHLNCYFLIPKLALDI